MRVLAGDIGGTKTWLRLEETEAPGQVIVERKFVSAEFSSLQALVECFIQNDVGDLSQPIAAASFGLAGPVNGRSAQLTNLPWQVEADVLQSSCQIQRVELLNDFQAAAFGIDTLARHELKVLHDGEYDGRGNRLVVGAGTGLGVAPVVRCLDGFWPQPCEGGHMDFAPTDSEQQQVLHWLWQLWDHASYERVLSGPGLSALHAYFSGAEPVQDGCWLEPAQIHVLAEQGDKMAQRALKVFVKVYGSYIGNVALLWPARAGVYIAGGIAAKIEGWMRRDMFLHSLHHKGRMQKLIKSMPVYLVTDESLGLRGAMNRAHQLAINGMSKVSIK